MEAREFNARDVLPEELIELYSKDYVVYNAFHVCFLKEYPKEKALIEVIKLLAKHHDELLKSVMEMAMNQPQTCIFKINE